MQRVGAGLGAWIEPVWEAAADRALKTRPQQEQKRNKATVTDFNDTFFRLEPQEGIDPSAIITSPILTGPSDLLDRVKRLDGIVLADWYPDAKQATAYAVGVVQEISGTSAVVDWRRADFTLHPNPQGVHKWKSMPVFKFDKAVAARYGLADRFCAAFAGKNVDVESPARPALRPRIGSPVATMVSPRPAVKSETNPKASSPQRNRVGPNGEIFADPARGTIMGNRTSPPRWLICDLNFERDLKEERKYTKLFFLDEAVALAAGHRPCNTCRRSRLQAYLDAARAETAIQGATELDNLLNAARQQSGPTLPLASLPDGAFVALGADDFRLKWSAALHRWTPVGYVDPVPLAEFPIKAAAVLTPSLTLAALSNGYVPDVHPSVAGG